MKAFSKLRDQTENTLRPLTFIVRPFPPADENDDDADDDDANDYGDYGGDDDDPVVLIPTLPPRDVGWKGKIIYLRTFLRNLFSCGHTIKKRDNSKCTKIP